MTEEESGSVCCSIGLASLPSVNSVSEMGGKTRVVVESALSVPCASTERGASTVPHQFAVEMENDKVKSTTNHNDGGTTSEKAVSSVVGNAKGQKKRNGNFGTEREAVSKCVEAVTWDRTEGERTSPNSEEDITRDQNNCSPLSYDEDEKKEQGPDSSPSNNAPASSEVSPNDDTFGPVSSRSAEGTGGEGGDSPGAGMKPHVGENGIAKCSANGESSFAVNCDGRNETSSSGGLCAMGGDEITHEPGVSSPADADMNLTENTKKNERGGKRGGDLRAVTGDGTPDAKGLPRSGISIQNSVSQLSNEADRDGSELDGERGKFDKVVESSSSSLKVLDKDDDSKETACNPNETSSHTSVEGGKNQHKKLPTSAGDTVGIESDDDDIIEISDENPASFSARTKNPPPTARSAAPPEISAGEASYTARLNSMPSWMTNSIRPAIQPPVTLAALPAVNNVPLTKMRIPLPLAPPTSSAMGGGDHQPNFAQASNLGQQMYQSTTVRAPISAFLNDGFAEPIYLTHPPGFVPTWRDIVPPPQIMSVQPTSETKTRRFYKLSLLSVYEFTVTAQDRFASAGGPTTLAGLRVHIKKIARTHGKAVFERDADYEGGRWRIPLGAYHAFYTFLSSDPMNFVEGIPENQLKIATLGREQMDKEYPSADKLKSQGIPPGLAKALAPYQRGGVDFVLEKKGKALIADEMGLGKTIQGIAAMTVFEKEWPLLVLCPSSARYHWEYEFRHWLGVDSSINAEESVSDDSSSKKRKVSDDDDDSDSGIKRLKNSNSERSIPPNSSKSAMPLLRKHHIHVISSGKDVICRRKTRVVVCSYGLVPNLIDRKKITPGQFQCIIVDESHMLKNKKTKRTSKLLPILKSAKRCVLLSGTPAFAKPMELWPQLTVLGAGSGWWQDEMEFVSKYARDDANRNNRAELHTLLTSTVMIRRMKADILKSLPPKIRERARVQVVNSELRREIARCINILREGTGVLGELARTHSHLFTTSGLDDDNEESSTEQSMSFDEARGIVRREIEQKHTHGMDKIHKTVMSNRSKLNEDEMERRVQEMEDKLSEELEEYRTKRLEELMGTGNIISNGGGSISGMQSSHATTSGISNFEDHEDVQKTRKRILNHLYKLTGQAKVPIVVTMLKRWLKDKTKGKLCIFAHHISVLDGIAAGAGLSKEGRDKKFIRIEGSTPPEARQAQIRAFQSDPTVRVALLGITAAGVAVTLTASSTVWFAELFWTPAIMIQAEDRCHRIGQQGKVRCLYIVAKGTVDELLWKLIEKKFRDLGEFVEGKEKQQIVVHRTYDDEKGTANYVASDEESDAGSASSSDEEETSERAPGDHAEKRRGSSSLAELAETSADIQQDIEELGMTERAMLDAGNNEDDEVEFLEDDASSGYAQSMAKPEGSRQESSKMGSTETSAICLLDDEVEKIEDGPVDKNGRFEMPKLRLYKMYFPGPFYGLVLSYHRGRVVVKGVNEVRIQRFGRAVKPDVGDIIVSINGFVVPHGANYEQTLVYMKHCIEQTPPVEIMFAEDAEFRTYFQATPMSANQTDTASSRSQKGGNDITRTGEGVNFSTGAARSRLKEETEEMAPLATAGNTGVGGSESNAIELLDD